MFTEYKIEFNFKGKRNYVQGGDIYDETLSVIKEKENDYPILIKWTFHSFLLRQGLIRIYEDHKLLHDNKRMRAEFLMKFKNKVLKGYLLERQEEIKSSYEYVESDVLCDSRIEAKKITMEYKEKYTYIEQIIAMTKSLHHNLYPDIKKWLFTRLSIGFLIDPGSYSRKLICVKALKNFNNSLTKNLIMIDHQHIGDIYFSKY